MNYQGKITNTLSYAANSGLLIVLLLCSINLNACAQESSGGTVLHAFPVVSDAASKNIYVELALAPCQKSGCPILVQLNVNGKVTQKYTLQWPAPGNTFSSAPVGRWYGAGDLLDESSQYESWTIGNESGFVTVVAQPFKWKNSEFSLAIHQTAGVEHTHRHHEVFVMEKNKLKRIWNHTEGQGPTLSSIYIPDAQAANELLYIETLQTGDPENPDNIDISYLTRINNAKGVQLSSKGATPVFTISINSFDSVMAAREYLEQNLTCLGYDFYVQKKSSGISLTAVSFTKSATEKMQQKLNDCIKDKKISVQ